MNKILKDKLKNIIIKEIQQQKINKQKTKNKLCMNKNKFVEQNVCFPIPAHVVLQCSQVLVYSATTKTNLFQ